MDLDLQLAIKLHNELNRVESPKSKKIVSTPKKNTTEQSKNSASIVDPEWEITDPNPDIYSLFQVFDRKYFWGRLDSVEVKWSPRMYSCAGICTFKGKLGGCSIALSLPLLKLRPRKDLVETLLHEMIHAFLFIADKNGDRGEHGPKFHAHMNRINKEAGTKITVYHTFIDEVKHYQQHWWRCNGPCQKQKPYFGLVKRSMNRAPGPNDFWFAEHKSRCGGEFIKIKEPDNFKSRKRKGDTTNKESKTKVSSITSLVNQFPSTSKKKKDNSVSPASSKGIPWKKTGEGTSQGSLNNFFSSKNNSAPTFKNENHPSTSPKTNSKINNIHGFKNLSDSCSSPSTGAVAPIKKKVILPFSGSGKVLGGKTSDPNKSRLLTQFLQGGGTSKVIKKDTSSKSHEKQGEIPSVSLLSDEDEILVNCPVCSQEMPNSDVNKHLENCLESVFERSAIDELTEEPDIPEETQPMPVLCPVCGIRSSVKDINHHLDNCLG